MLALRLTVFALLFCGTCGFSRYWFNLFNNCNPPQKLVGKFCAALLDNDVDGDGKVDNKDLDLDLLFYNYDDDRCTSETWEVVTRWTCRYGFSEQYARFMLNRFDRNQDGAITRDDFGGSFAFANDDFLSLQYTRFKNDYCGDPKNRENPVDRVQCAEVDELKPEDIKCT
ncbi:uncharacterized protein LOC124147706 [Haliotis rufescens]|uniref:uncharacterized protein LOC124147706 n=1 Tax=Haliotis rufescens TaxID=6454 RepID=UPI00201E7688|nr:uncharacterized protein LOC124147706 [Haliotis rufescens]